MFGDAWPSTALGVLVVVLTALGWSFGLAGVSELRALHAPATREGVVCWRAGSPYWIEGSVSRPLDTGRMEGIGDGEGDIPAVAIGTREPALPIGGYRESAEPGALQARRVLRGPLAAVRRAEHRRLLRRAAVIGFGLLVVAVPLAVLAVELLPEPFWDELFAIRPNG